MRRRHDNTTPRFTSPLIAEAGKTQPTEERIRARAYEKFCSRSGDPGDAMGDWLEAERELLGEMAGALSAEP